jgi:PAS domain S-box-containing protein
VTGETILLVDDNVENTEFMVDYLLVPNGYTPMVASDGRQGLAMALTRRPDLIILDFRLPGMSGLDVLQALREKSVDIPVIFITAYGSEDDIVSCFRLGIKDYFRKPFDVERMLATVERVFSEKRQQEQQTAQQHELEEYIKELGTLYGSSLERVLNRIVEIATALTGAEEGYLLLVDQQTDELYMRSALNLGERFAREFRIKIKDSITGRVVRTGKPVRYNYLDESDRFKVKTGYLVKALINVPLSSNGRTIGVLGVDNKMSSKTFSRADQDLLVLLAEHAATAIGNASLYGQTHKDLIRQVKEFTVMQEVARDLNAIMDLDRIARLVLHHAQRMTSAEAGIIGLVANDNQMQDIHVNWTSTGYLTALIENRSWAPDWKTDIIGQAASSGRAVLVNHALMQAERELPSARGPRLPYTRSRLAMPILRGGRVLGVIEIQSSKPNAFTNSTQRFLTTLADHAAVAIENTLLFDMVLDEQNKTKFILQSIADGVYTVDRDLHILTFNPAAERITGWREDEARGKPCTTVFHEAGNEMSIHQATLIQQVLSSGEPVTSDPDAPAILTRDGHPVYISSSASPLRNRENTVVGVVVAFRDVSAERELDRLKSDFVSMVSHELRSPLANLSAAIELMLDASDHRTPSIEPLHIARANAQRLTHLIENILNVSQIEAGQMRVQVEPIILLSVIRQVIEGAQAQTSRHQLMLRAPESIPFVLADKSKIEIVLNNLLTNAINYSPLGGRVLVRIARAVRNEIVVSVIDEGIGISPEHLDKLFTRFYRVDASDGRDVYGHGLGLYISKHLIELQGGRIWVRSKEGNGSCFSFTLPIVPEPEPQEDPEYLETFED